MISPGLWNVLKRPGAQLLSRRWNKKKKKPYPCGRLTSSGITFNRMILKLGAYKKNTVGFLLLLIICSDNLMVGPTADLSAR